MPNIKDLVVKQVKEYKVFNSDIVVYNPRHKANKEIAEKYIAYMNSLQSDPFTDENKYKFEANLLAILTNIEGLDNPYEFAEVLKGIIENPDSEDDISQDLRDALDFILDIVADTAIETSKNVKNMSKLATIQMNNSESKKVLNKIESSNGMALTKKDRNNKTVILNEIKNKEIERKENEDKLVYKNAEKINYEDMSLEELEELYKAVEENERRIKLIKKLKGDEI